jgi:hypothetical protein
MAEDYLSVEDLIKQLKRLPNKKLPVAINNQTGLPFNYLVTGVVSASNYDVAHLFDQTRPLPTAECIYLLVKIEPES